MTEQSVFISYTHDSQEHEDAVLELSDRLRREGVDCNIDQYEESPEEGWPRWCERQVEEAGFVLVVCTETYLRRFKGKEAPGKGLGGTWEGFVITQELYNAQGKNKKFIPILFDQEVVGSIPLTLQGATHYRLLGDYERLYRRLTGQPAVVKEQPGEKVAMARRLLAQPSRERSEESGPIWQVPYRKSVFFTGREEVLRGLRQGLDGRGIAALSGMGGLGKTQTAIEYAYRYRGEYKAVFWVEAETRETLLAGFGSIAKLLKLPAAGAKEQERAVREVQGWLEGSAGWLLILDNADELAMVKEFLPPEARGHVLLTTRASKLAGMAEGVAVPAMLPEEGALLLLRRAGAIAKDQRLADAGETDRRFAVELSRELGGLPLALDQAGAFIEETSRSVSEYAGLYRSERASLLAERGALGEHASVAVTFSLAFKRVEDGSAAAGDLMRLCAFLAPDAIPEEIFTAGEKSVLGESLAAAAKNGMAFAMTTGEACRFSLLDRDAKRQTLEIHRLVQEVIKAGMSKEEQRQWAERSVRAVWRAFPSIEYKNWGLCQRLIVHAQACAGLIEEWEFGFAEAARLLNETAVYLKERALYAEAEPLYVRSLAILEGALGPEHPDVARSLNNLAGLFDIQGKDAEAEPLYVRSLAIRERALGPEHPDVATSLNNLAGLYYVQGKYTEAEPLLVRSLAIREGALGPEHPDVAQSLNNLAVLYDSQGRYAEAEPLYVRSLAIRERALGPKHPDVATNLNNLAVLYDNQGRYVEAEPLYVRSLAIRERALGDGHPDVAQSLNNLAVLYDHQGRYVEAEPLYVRSLAIRERALGPGHPDVALSLKNLASFYEERGREAEAEPLRRRLNGMGERAG